MRDRLAETTRRDGRQKKFHRRSSWPPWVGAPHTIPFGTAHTHTLVNQDASGRPDASAPPVPLPSVATSRPPAEPGAVCGVAGAVLRPYWVFYFVRIWRRPGRCLRTRIFSESVLIRCAAKSVCRTVSFRGPAVRPAGW